MIGASWRIIREDPSFEMDPPISISTTSIEEAT